MAKQRLQKKLQQQKLEKNIMYRVILKCIECKNFEIAKTKYNKLALRGNEEAQLQYDILRSITEKFTLEEIKNIFNIFNINVKTFSVEYKEPVNISFTSTPVIIDMVHLHWSNDKNTAKLILNHFIEQGISLQSSQSYNNALMHALMKYPNDLDFIKMLLESKTIDINTVITPKTDKTCKVVKTPFSIAFGKLNEDLLLLLLKYGADPYLATDKARQYVEKIYGKEVDFKVASGLGRNNLSDEEQQEYFCKVDKLIEGFFLEKLIKEHNVATQQTLKLEKKEKDANTNELISEQKNLILKKEQETNYKKLSSTEGIQNTITLDKYISYKEQASQNTYLPVSTREEHKFDALVLKYVETKDESIKEQYLESINELLAKTDDQNYSYYITCLMLINVELGDASTILATKPRLLNKFYTLKKRLYEEEISNTKTELKDLELQEGIYKISGNWTNQIFLKVSPELLNTLDSAYAKKIKKQLSNPKFIKSNSMGISGIKDYPGSNISKIKIAQTDCNLVSLVRYLDKNGNLVIEFNELQNHKNMERLMKGKKGICKKCEDIGSIIYHTDDISVDTDYNYIEPQITTVDPVDSFEIEMIGLGAKEI